MAVTWRGGCAPWLGRLAVNTSQREVELPVFFDMTDCFGSKKTASDFTGPNLTTNVLKLM
jgi:hypothetical protein